MKSAKSAKSVKSVKSAKSTKTMKTMKTMKRSIYSAIVPTFLGMLNTVKLYHWRTTSFATHKATDQLYADLNAKVDTFVETLLGTQSRANILSMGRTISVQTNTDLKKTMASYKQFLMRLSTDPQFNIAANTDLLAQRDELLAVINQFLYLITLN